MKTNKTIRSIVAMMVIFFAVSTTSCNKEENITPTNPASPNVPVVPPTPAVPVVSLKPTSILTTLNGTTVRKEVYEYNTDGKLIKYESTGTFLDSVLVREGSVIFKIPGSNNAGQVLTFNIDKTFKSLFSATDQIDFENNLTKLSRMTKARPNTSPLTLGVFNYINNNLNTIGSEIRIDINYHDNLPYQKGINEIPVVFKPIKYFKIMEQENATATTLYNKLIRQVILNFGGGRLETHSFAYVFDVNNRVTQIIDTVTNITSTSSTQKVLVSAVSY